MGVGGILTCKREKGGVTKCFVKPGAFDRLRGYGNQQALLPQSVDSRLLSPPPDTYNLLNQIGIYWSYILLSSLIQ